MRSEVPSARRLARAPTRRRAATPRRRRATTARDARDASGGANFERLVAQNDWLFPQPARDDERDALDAFWRAKGVRDDHQRARLVAVGRDLARGVAERELYRNPDALARATRRLETLLPPGADVAALLWRCPEIVELPLRDVARRLIAFKRAFPSVDVERVLAGNPRALLLDDADVVARAVDALAREFPQVDMMAVIAFEPHVLHRSLPARVRALRAVKPGDRSPSLRAFYPAAADDARAAAPMKNAQLFAKVFLLTTDCSFPRGDV